MGLIDRVATDQAAQQAAQAAARDAGRAMARQTAAEVWNAVRAHLDKIAGIIGEPLVLLTPEGAYPLYFDLGEVVFRIVVSGQSALVLDASRPNAVLEYFLVDLVGTDPHRPASQRQLQFRRVGTLRYLAYDGIASAIAQTDPAFSCDPQVVAQILAERQRAADLPRCGKLVLHVPTAGEMAAMLEGGIDLSVDPRLPCLLEQGHKGDCNPLQ
jgi:hypothetical protein